MVRTDAESGDIEMDEEVMEELRKRGISTLEELKKALEEKKIDIRVMGEKDDDIRD